MSALELVKCSLQLTAGVKCQICVPLPPPPSVVDHKCAMLFRRYVSRTAAGSGRAVLEGVGLSPETIQRCYTDWPHNEEEVIQSGLMKWRNGSGFSTTWAVLIKAMKYAEIGTHHIEAMKKELLEGEACQLPSVLASPSLPPGAFTADSDQSRSTFYQTLASLVAYVNKYT